MFFSLRVARDRSQDESDVSSDNISNDGYEAESISSDINSAGCLYHKSKIMENCHHV